MALEEMQKSFDSSNLLEPSILFEDSEDSSQHVSAVRSTSSVARQSSILDNHQHCSSMIKHHIEIFDRDDGFFDMLKR